MESDNKMSYKVIFVGDGRVGKTSFLKRIRTGQFERQYFATVGAEHFYLTFNTNYGQLVLNCWDCAGQEKFWGLRERHYTGGDAAVVMFDLTSKQSYKNSRRWCLDIRRVCPQIPIILCGNKCDELDRKIKPKDVTLHRKIGANYYDISAKTLYNQDKPFLCLARKLTGKDDLVFQ